MKDFPDSAEVEKVLEGIRRLFFPFRHARSSAGVHAGAVVRLAAEELRADRGRGRDAAPHAATIPELAGLGSWLDENAPATTRGPRPCQPEQHRHY